MSDTGQPAGSFRPLWNIVSREVRGDIVVGRRTSAKNDMGVPGSGSTVLARGLVDVPLNDDGSGGWFGTDMRSVSTFED